MQEQRGRENGDIYSLEDPVTAAEMGIATRTSSRAVRARRPGRNAQDNLRDILIGEPFDEPATMEDEAYWDEEDPN